MMRTPVALRVFASRSRLTGLSLMSHYAGPSQATYRSISGTTAGLLDPTQLERLHRVPGSILSFASFHPLTATSDHDLSTIRKLSLNEESFRPKRIVIETIAGPNGGSFWRFVPRARREDGVEDEGPWPRMIDICGEVVHCTQDQWDIYKLDLEYDCFVPLPPKITVISKKKGKTRESVPEAPPNVASTFPAPNAKRKLPTPSSDERPTAESRKRFRPATTATNSSDGDGRDPFHPISISDDEEDEVEGLVIGEEAGRNGRGLPPHPTRFADRAKRSREDIDTRRRERRQRTTQRTQTVTEIREADQEMVDLTMDDTRSSEPTPGGSPLHTAKRKVSPAQAEDTSNRNGTSPYAGQSRLSPPTAPVQRSKRIRTQSPPRSRGLDAKRSRFEQAKMNRYRVRENWWKEHKHKRFMSEVPEDLPEELRNLHAGATYEYQTSTPPAPDTVPDNNSVVDEEALRQAAIEESRRKLADLEKDRPIWEEAARRRQAEERVEEQARQARREAERRAAEQEELRRRREAEAESEERARAEREKAQREQQHQRRKQQQRWSHGPWTTQRALERYKSLCETFDTTKFTTDTPLTFLEVPWPVLQSPTILTVEDIGWSAVEVFFHSVRPHMRSQDYKQFVEKSHKRFHPDRWRARGLLRSVEDEELRNCLEVAANTVAQALTPLWREVKGG